MQGQPGAGGSTEPVRQERVGDVLVLVLAYPPVNALGQMVRAGLMAGLARAQAEDVRAVVIMGEGRGFSAGADIAEFGRPTLAPVFGAVMARIEGLGKPVIAAISGMALGGGCELALAAHYRIAEAKAVIGLPEVSLGILPGAGGTQRLPRLIGAEAALRLMLTGVPVGAAEALALGLVDQVVEGDLLEAALALARQGPAVRRTGEAWAGMRDMAAFRAAVTAARAGLDRILPAPGRIVDCVEAAALLPLAQGLEMERVAFEDLVMTPEAAGLRYAFFSERKAFGVAGAMAKGVSIGRIGVWGADEQTSDLCGQALAAGLSVALCDPDRGRLVAALERIAGRQEASVANGAMTEAAREAEWMRLTSTLAVDPLAGVDLVLMAPGMEDLGGAVPVAAVGGLVPGVDAAISVAGASGLAEMALRGDGGAAAGLLVVLARRVQWRLVIGSGVELALRTALAEAEVALEAEGIAAATIVAALAACGLGAGVPAGAMPVGGAGIVALCLAALAAEGARMLADGRALRPLDIDVVAVQAGLMPRWQGGPMYQADRLGLLVLRRDLRARAEAVFAVDPLIDGLIADGKGFASLNGGA